MEDDASDYSTEYPECLWYQQLSGHDLNLIIRVGEGASKQDFQVNAGVWMARCKRLRYLLPQQSGGLKPALEIPDVQPQQFRPFFEYVYRNEMSCFETFNDLIYGLYISKKLIQPPLIDKCREAICMSLETCPEEKVPILLNHRNDTFLENEQPLVDKADSLIPFNMSAIMRSEGISQVNFDTLEYIMSKCPDRIPEFDRVELLNRWSSKECSRRDLESTQENKLSLCSELLYQIRVQDIPTELLLTRVRDMDIIPYVVLLDTSRYNYDRSIEIPFPTDYYRVFEDDNVDVFTFESRPKPPGYVEEDVYSINNARRSQARNDEFKRSIEISYALDFSAYKDWPTGRKVKTEGCSTVEEPNTTWSLFIYPTGKTEEWRDWLAVYLACKELDSSYENQAYVHCMFYLEADDDEASNSSSSMLRRELNLYLDQSSMVKGYHQFMRRDQITDKCILRAVIQWSPVPAVLQLPPRHIIEVEGLSTPRVKLTAYWRVYGLQNDSGARGTELESPMFGRQNLLWSISLRPNGSLKDKVPENGKLPLRAYLDLKHLPDCLRDKGLRVAVRLTVGDVVKREQKTFRELDFSSWIFGKRDNFVKEEPLLIKADVKYAQF